MVEHWRRLEDIRAFGYHHRTPYLIEDIVRQAKFAVDRINPILRWDSQAAPTSLFHVQASGNAH